MESPTAKIYHHRLPESSPFFKVVSQHFSEFERTYSQNYEAKPESEKCDNKSLATWAMLIKMIFEVDMLVCPDCAGMTFYHLSLQISSKLKQSL